MKGLSKIQRDACVGLHLKVQLKKRPSQHLDACGAITSKWERSRPPGTWPHQAQGSLLPSQVRIIHSFLSIPQTPFVSKFTLISGLFGVKQNSTQNEMF